MNQISEMMKDFLKEEELEVFSPLMPAFTSLHQDEEILAVINSILRQLDTGIRDIAGGSGGPEVRC